LLIYVS